MKSNVKNILNNRYEIRGIINSGAFSVVYHAYDQWLKGDVAIKELSPLTRISSQEALVKRFKREARITRRLRHPYIIEIYDLFWAQDTLYIVMPYLPDSLDKRLKHTPCLNLSESVHIVTQICQGLAYAHTAFRDKQGVYPIVHCDIKPGNILFDEFDQVKIADFGIAHIPPLPGIVDQISITAFNAGTIAYMPPEQLDGERTDPRIDVYAIGALLYRMVTGDYYLDFEEVTTEHALQNNQRRIRYEAPSRVPLEAARVPEPLSDIIIKALAKDPQDRYIHAGAILDALKYAGQSPALPSMPSAHDGETPSEELPQPPTPVSAAIQNARPLPGEPESTFKSTSSRLLYFAIAAVALLIVAFGAMITGVLKPGGQTPIPSRKDTPTILATSVPYGQRDIPTTVITATAKPVASPTQGPTPLQGAPTGPLTPTPICTINPPPGWRSYIVRAGDDLTQLALSCRVSIQEIAHINCIRDTDHILAGQTLYLPHRCSVFYTATSTALPTPTATPTVSPTLPSSPTAVPVTPQILTPTQTALPSPTPAYTPTSTATPAVMPTDTIINPTATSTPSATPEHTPTIEATPTLAPTQPPPATLTPTPAPTLAPTTPITDTQTANITF